MNSRNNVRRSVGSKGRATAAAGRAQGRPPEQVHRVDEKAARDRSRPHGRRRLDRLHRPVQQDAGHRDAREGNAAGDVLPGRAEGSRRASRAGASTYTAGRDCTACSGKAPRNRSRASTSASASTRNAAGTGIRIGTKPGRARADREQDETERGGRAQQQLKNKRGCKPQESPTKVDGDGENDETRTENIKRTPALAALEPRHNADGHSGSERRTGARPEHESSTSRGGAHGAHVSTEEHGVYLTYDVKASGDTSVFCDAYQTGTGVCTEVGRERQRRTHGDLRRRNRPGSRRRRLQPAGERTAEQDRWSGLNGYKTTTKLAAPSGVTTGIGTRRQGPISAERGPAAPGDDEARQVSGPSTTSARTTRSSSP